MLYELVLSLLGHTGQVIVKSPQREAFEIASDFPISIPEADIVNKIGRVGWLFDFLASFVGMVLLWSPQCRDSMLDASSL